MVLETLLLMKTEKHLKFIMLMILKEFSILTIKALEHDWLAKTTPQESFQIHVKVL